MDKVPWKRLDHQIPFWAESDSTWFVTICAQRRGINQLCFPDIGRALLESIQHLNTRRRWYCELVLLMPDHIHLLVSLPEEGELSTVVGDWKRWSHSKLGVDWQRNFFDHRIRREEGLTDKAAYILHNPVRAELVERVEDWPYVWMPDEG